MSDHQLVTSGRSGASIRPRQFVALLRRLRERQTAERVERACQSDSAGESWRAESYGTDTGYT